MNYFIWIRVMHCQWFYGGFWDLKVPCPSISGLHKLFSICGEYTSMTWSLCKKTLRICYCTAKSAKSHECLLKWHSYKIAKLRKIIKQYGIWWTLLWCWWLNYRSRCDLCVMWVGSWRCGCLGPIQCPVIASKHNSRFVAVENPQASE